MRRKKILVIDDDPVFLKLVDEALDQEGYQVFTALSGSEGLQLFFSKEPDIVLLDVVMPRMDGWQICQRIRDVSDVPIIMITGTRYTENDVVRGLEYGANDYIFKPVGRKELVARTRQFLRLGNKIVRSVGIPQVESINKTTTTRKKKGLKAQNKKVFVVHSRNEKEQTGNNLPAEETFDWDAFICHATEDKDSFVRELAQKLVREGVRVWYDEFTLQIGQSLRRSIDKGLVNSRYGIVVLSHAFFQKEWPQTELDGLTTRERNGEKVILPVWLDVDREEVVKYSITLADKMAAKARNGIGDVIDKLLTVLRPSSLVELNEIIEQGTEVNIAREKLMTTKESMPPKLLSTTIHFNIERPWGDVKGEMFATLINWIEYEEVKDTTFTLNFPSGSFKYIHQELQGLTLSSNNLPLEKIIETFGETYPMIIFTIDKPFNFGDLVKRSRGGIRTIDFLSNKTMKFSLHRASITLTNSDKENTITIVTNKSYAFRSAIPPVSYNSVIDYLEKDPPPEELENYLQKVII